MNYGHNPYSGLETLDLKAVKPIRGDTEGAWIQLKKPTLENLPILNLPKLKAQKLTRLSGFYELIAREHLLPISECEKDSVRSRIDDEIQRALGLPDNSPRRQALSHEPIVSLKALWSIQLGDGTRPTVWAEH